MKKLLTIFLFFITSMLYSQANYWHYYQFDFEGIGLCGPTCVAMVYKYFTGDEINVTTIEKLISIRELDGATNIDSLCDALKQLKIPNRKKSITFKNNFTFEQNLYIINIDTEFILNKDYLYNGGHYIILFDYFDGYFLANDPLVKEGFSWYYEDDIRKALRHSTIIEVPKWKMNKY